MILRHLRVPLTRPRIPFSPPALLWGGNKPVTGTDFINQGQWSGFHSCFSSIDFSACFWRFWGKSWQRLPSYTNRWDNGDQGIPCPGHRLQKWLRRRYCEDQQGAKNSTATRHSSSLQPQRPPAAGTRRPASARAAPPPPLPPSPWAFSLSGAGLSVVAPDLAEGCSEDILLSPLTCC